MGREYADYRDNLALIAEHYPRKAALSLPETAEFLGCDYRTLKNSKTFPVVKCGRTYSVPVVGLAKWLSKYSS